MKKLKFWRIECIRDTDHHSIRARTKKRALEIYHKRNDPNWYGDYVELVELEYEDAFDLADGLMSEGGMWSMRIDGETRKYKIKK